jgi:spermidine synthase
MRNHGHRPAGGAGIIVLCFFLSGATGLVYQVVWLRLLGLVFGHTVYATTTVLSVEIEPAVVEASRFFRQLHGGVLEDPRVRTIIADGRNSLLAARERYDVIISEPSNPWMSGLASMFSEEFFRLARERLRPGEIMLQWIQSYNIRPEDFRMVVNTFRSAFPAPSIWNPVRGDFLLLGRRESSPIDLDQVCTRFDGNPQVRRELERIGVRAWPGILGFFMLGEADTARFAQGGGLNTDDRLPLEFSAPRARYLETGGTNWRLVHQFRQASLPEVTASSRPALVPDNAQFQVALRHLERTVVKP